MIDSVSHGGFEMILLLRFKMQYKHLLAVPILLAFSNLAFAAQKSYIHCADNEFSLKRQLYDQDKKLTVYIGIETYGNEKMESFTLLPPITVSASTKVIEEHTLVNGTVRTSQFVCVTVTGQGN